MLSSLRAYLLSCAACLVFLPDYVVACLVGLLTCMLEISGCSGCFSVYLLTCLDCLCTYVLGVWRTYLLACLCACVLKCFLCLACLCPYVLKFLCACVLGVLTFLSNYFYHLHLHKSRNLG